MPLEFIEKGSMPLSARSDITTTVIGSKVYLVGGLTSNPQQEGRYYGSDQFFSYDTENDSWEQLQNYTFPFYGMCSATDGERIWSFGGYDERKVNNYRGTYNVSSNTWEVGLLSDYIYGCSAAYIPATGKVLAVYGNFPAVMYDPVTDTFEDLSAYFSGTERCAGSVFYNDKLWLAGAHTDPTQLRTVSANGTQWETKASNPNGLTYADMIRVNDVLLTFGGVAYADEFGTGYSRVNMYNITSDEWTTLSAELPLPFNGVAATLVGPSIYLFGGGYYEGDLFALTNKYWVAPCVDPSVCEYGCDSQSGKCNLPPVAPVSTAPTTQPATQSPSSSAPTGSKTPQAKTSSSVAKNVSLVLSVLAFFALV